MTATPEMIERVARAICRARFLHGSVDDDGWDEASEALRYDYRAQARAAIEAMREPTEAMFEAGKKATQSSVMMNPAGQLGVSCHPAYQAMIDAALAEPDEP